MKLKRILRFYFSAESLERAFGNIIIANACNTACNFNAEVYAEKICVILGEKQTLSRLWGYLDGIIGGLTEEERVALENYSRTRAGLGALCDGERREIKRAAMKFRRRARRLESFGDALGLVGKYYCLISTGQVRPADG